MRKLVTLFLSQMCNIVCFAQIIINPVFDRTGFEVYRPHVDKVEIKKDSTKVYCSINFQESCSYGIPRTLFLEDLENNKKYQIKKCIGLPFLPKEELCNSGTIQFVFCFPHIENLHKFNLIEDPSNEKIFNIYGIDITKNYSKSFEENEYNRFKSMSDFYKSSGNISKFVEFEEKELSSAQYIFGNKSLHATLCYQVLADYYNETGDYDKAIALGLQALECDSIHFGVENPVYAIMLRNLSYYYNSAGKETEYLKCAQKCIKIRRNIGDEEKYLEELYCLLLTGRGNNIGISKRISIVKGEIESFPSFIDINSLTLVKLYKQMAQEYNLIDDNDDAIEYCNKAFVVMDSNNKDKSEEYAELLTLKCHCQRRSGLKKEALVSGEAANQLYKSLNIESVQYAKLLDELAFVYELNYDLEKSTQLRMTAAEIYKNEKDLLSLSAIYSSISDAYQYAEKLDDAEKYIKKAIDVFNDYDNNDQVIMEGADTNDSLSNVFKQREINYNRVFNFSTLAQIYFKQGKIVDAINTEMIAGNILKNMGDYQSYALFLETLSIYYLKNSQYSEAVACAEQSVQLSAGDSLRQAQSKMQLAMVLFQSGDTEKAIHYTEECVPVFKLHNNNDYRISAQLQLSNFYWNNHSYDKAEQYLSEVLDYLQKSISTEVTGMTTEQRQRLWARYVNYFYLYRNIIEKSDKNATLLSKLYNYILFSKNLLLDTEIQLDIEEKERINITWKDIQQELSDDDIAIEFISTIDNADGYHTYHALVVDKKCSNPQMIILYKELDLKEIRKADARNIDDIVGELIWSPIIDQYPKARNIYFSPDGVLHILPIEYYNVDSIKNMSEHYSIYRLSSTKELVRKRSKQQFNSAALFGGLDYNSLKDISSEENVGREYIQWRSVAERGGFDPLPNTLSETQEIKDLLDEQNISTILYTGEYGTEESFRELSGKNNSIVHIATHGMYVMPNEIETKRDEHNFIFLELLDKKDPVKESIALTHSFLVMAGGNSLVMREAISDKSKDGILTSKEISQLDLRNLDIVVLSACESAKGDIYSDGIYGLQRGFKKAGANTILMSLDKVDDEATRILMVEFYRNLVNGKSKHESLKEAQQYLRKVEKGKYDDPKYWASFIMMDGLN